MTELQLAILEIERHRWKHAGAKAEHVRTQLGLTPTAYAVELGRILDDPAALAADAPTVRRLTRLREQRRAHRSARRLDDVGR